MYQEKNFILSGCFQVLKSGMEETSSPKSIRLLLLFLDLWEFVESDVRDAEHSALRAREKAFICASSSGRAVPRPFGSYARSSEMPCRCGRCRWRRLRGASETSRR